MRYAVLVAMVVALTSCAGTGRATMKGCDIRNSRNANPYGSVLVPPAPPAPVAADDEGAE